MYLGSISLQTESGLLINLQAYSRLSSNESRDKSVKMSKFYLVIEMVANPPKISLHIVRVQIVLT